MSKFRTAVEALSCDLLVLHMTTPDAKLAVPRAAGTMWGGVDTPEVFGSHFLAVLDVMARPEVGLITEHGRGYKFAGSGGQPTTIAPTPAFLARLGADDVSWPSFRRVAGPVLVLKAPKSGAESGRAIPFRETNKTRKLRREVESLNENLLSITLFLTSYAPADLTADDDGRPIDPTRLEVRRIFNNGDWMQGGRLFGGFWEEMPKVSRRLIRLGTRRCPEGEPIVNVDFEQLFPRLAYVLAGLTAPDGDLYDIVGGRRYRDGWKKLVNALLFAEGRLNNWPRGALEHFPPGTKLRDCLEAIHRKHAAIAGQLGCGLGYRLMFIESQMLLAGLKALRTLSIPALPLHDSVLVGLSDAEEARDVMVEAFKAHTNEPRGHVEIKYNE